MILTFDFETTGPDPATANPVSVAVVRHEPDGAHEVILNQLLNPGIPIPEGASAVHGIFDDDVASAPDWQSCGPMLSKLFDGTTAVVAHNVLYDAPIYVRACQEVGEPFVYPRWLCTLTWARCLWWGRSGLQPYPKGGHADDPEKRTLDLESICRYFDIELEDAHHAAADAMAVARILSPLKALCAGQPRLSDHFHGVHGLHGWTAQEATGHSDFLARVFGGGPRPTWSDISGVSS